MDAVVMPFSIMGFTFGIIAYTQIASAVKKIEDLEQRILVLESDRVKESP